MSYTLDDVTKCPLREDLREQCYGDIFGLLLDIDHEMFVKHILTWVTATKNYKNTVEYLMAETNKERAVLAMSSGMTVSQEKVDEVLKFWTKYADKMSGLEKAMEGWSKV